MATAEHWASHIQSLLNDAIDNRVNVFINLAEDSRHFRVTCSDMPPAKTEVELLREEIARLKAERDQPFQVPARDPVTDGDVFPAPPPNTRVRSQAILTAGTVREINQELPVTFKAENDGSGFVRVYGGSDFVGVIEEDEIESLVQGITSRLESGTARIGRQFLATQEQYAAQPRRNRPRRPVPVMQVPNLYAERDPGAGGGPAYSLS